MSDTNHCPQAKGLADSCVQMRASSLWMTFLFPIHASVTVFTIYTFFIFRYIPSPPHSIFFPQPKRYGSTLGWPWARIPLSSDDVISPHCLFFKIFSLELESFAPPFAKFIYSDFSTLRRFCAVGSWTADLWFLSIAQQSNRFWTPPHL